MNVNGITSSNGYDAYSMYKASTKTKKDSSEHVEKDERAAVYESSVKSYQPNKELVAKLQADMQARTDQLQNIVEQMLMKQGNTYGIANNIYSILSKGNFTVDAATKTQAQNDISEDGFFGVKQTSSRIIDFAKALTGGDPDKIQEMRKAFEKGFKQAERTWGGKLPEISQKTYQAVMDQFDEWSNSSF